MFYTGISFLNWSIFKDFRHSCMFLKVNLKGFIYLHCSIFFLSDPRLSSISRQSELNFVKAFLWLCSCCKVMQSFYFIWIPYIIYVVYIWFYIIYVVYIWFVFQCYFDWILSTCFLSIFILWLLKMCLLKCIWMCFCCFML